MARCEDRKLHMLVGHAQARRERLDEAHSGFLVSVMRGPKIARGRSFPQVMHEHGETHGGRGTQAHGTLQRHHDVDTGVDLRMPTSRLRHTVERCDLGKDHLQSSAVAQGLKEKLGSHLPECPLRFLPDPLGHEGVDFTALHHGLHQGQGFRRYRKPAIAEACGEARHAQHAHRILDEGFRDVAQNARLKITPAAVRIDELARITLRDGIDRKITALEILLERDVRGESGAEAAVARSDFGLQARECIFLVRFGMQEDRKVTTDGEVAELLKIRGLGADDHPVALAHGDAQELITDGTADQVDLHARMLTESFAETRLAASAPRMRRVIILRGLLASLALALLPACGTLYIAQAARGEWQVLHERRPIASVMSDARTSPALRERLAAVSEARNFASAQLGLPDNKSYRSYADLKRPFVVWNVVAAPEFSIEPARWCFPIAGCVAYRGYFSQHQADAFAAQLARKSFDVLVQGVPAYSTLGRFSDPVLNTMLIYGDDELAAIVFHELAHQLIYVAGDSEFNEAFAVTVEETGLARWLEFLGRKEQLEHYQKERVRDLQFNMLFAQRRAELARLYASKLPAGSHARAQAHAVRPTCE